MLLSPERFMMENFRESLIAMTEKNHVHFAYGVIDEVHCVQNGDMISAHHICTLAAI
jgi:superfamily II DNA helicase RecQ